MFSSKIKNIALASALVSAFALTGCLTGEEAGDPNAVTHLKVTTTVNDVQLSNAGLSKANLITYSRVLVTLTSNSSTPNSTDTLRDTITPGELGFAAASNADYTINTVYTVKALRTWTLNVSVRDANDSVIHTGTATSNTFVKLGLDTALATLNLTPRFNMYRGIFTALPDSITTGAGVTTHKQGIKFTALYMKVDGKVVKTMLNPSGFPNGAANPDTLDWDYVLTGQRTIRLVAYGSLLNAAGAVVLTDSLFAGEVIVTPTIGINGAQSFALSWTNPQNVNGKGSERINVTIGKIGRTTLSGTTTGVGVVPKGR
jgi:hypothetical protein